MYDVIYTNKKTGQFLECRQGNQPTFGEMTEEARLYKAWAEYHYKCEVTYTIKFD